MKIKFMLRDDPRRPAGYLAQLTMPETLYYEAYVADVVFEFKGSKESFQSTPMIYFVSTLQNLLMDAFVTSQLAKAHLWDTGLCLSLRIVDEEFVELEIPMGTVQLRYPLQEFIPALKTVTLELLWTMFDDEPELLSKGKLFADGSPLDRVAQLILQGKMTRQKKKDI